MILTRIIVVSYTGETSKIRLFTNYYLFTTKSYIEWLVLFTFFFSPGSMTEVAFLLNLAAGFFLGSRSKAFVSDVAVLNRNLMGSALVISVPESTLNTSL